MSGNGKPLKDIIFIIRSLSLRERISRLNNHQAIHFDAEAGSACLLFHRGSAALRRKSDDRVVARIHSPSVIGLNSVLGPDPYHHYYLQATSELDVERVGVARLSETLSAKNLWEPACRILSWNINQLYLTTIRADAAARREPGSGAEYTG